MNFEDLLTTIVIAGAVLVLIAAALLIWSAILLLRIKDIARSIESGRFRDHSGRPLRERF
jgi:hypothetical protein